MVKVYHHILTPVIDITTLIKMRWTLADHMISFGYSYQDSLLPKTKYPGYKVAWGKDDLA
jgi:hypothetical protein